MCEKREAEEEEEEEEEEVGLMLYALKHSSACAQQ